MEEPIQVVLKTAPLWERLLTLLAPLAGGAVAVMAGIWLERRRGARARRQEHLREIQDKVFRPLNQKVRGYFLPMLLPAASNIELQEEHGLRTGVVATEYSWERREQLQVVHPDLSSIETPSHALYDCSKRVHYPEVIHQYEVLEADVNDYQSQCLAYVQSLAERIEQHIGLPNQPPAPWVRAEALALHIYQRQRGFVAHGVRLRDAPTNPTNTVELPGGSGVIIQVTQAEANRALELVTELENSRERLNELHSRAATLRQRAVELGDTLERLLYTSSLKGKCDFLSE